MDDNSQKRITTLKTINIALEFGFIIALPLVFFVYLGKYLDYRYGTKYLVLIGVLLALSSSAIWLYRRIKEILRELRNK